ncbi:MAG: antibiotic biosynthesis monooxygenase [Alphaproteobacteria bacterium]|nr:antibiotic biosynthesis monooxygenase [Alphaproteobacteria bacterium]
MSDFAPLPDPPYYAVIFTATVNSDTAGYDLMATKMSQLAARQPGYIGVEHSRNAQGLGITVSYWQDEDALAAWKAEAGHLLAQKMGKTCWYKYYTLRVAKVERAYSGPEGRM